MDYTGFIGVEVHHLHMEIQDAQEDKEHRYIDGGEEFFCPICGAVWLKEIEGGVTFGECEHLRFSLHSE